MISIGLNWERDAEGYELDDAGRFGKVIVSKGGKWIETKPFAGKFDMHYSKFANVKTPDDLKEFVNEYGYLKSMRALGGQTISLKSEGLVLGKESYDGERVDEHLEAARLVGLVMQAHNDGRKYFPLKLSRLLSDEDLGQFRIVPDPKKGFSFSFEATSLMNAIWIQLFQKISGGTQLRKCLQCGAWFEVGAESGKRADSKFCKTAHRVAYSRKTHSQGS